MLDNVRLLCQKLSLPVESEVDQLVDYLISPSYYGEPILFFLLRSDPYVPQLIADYMVELQKSPYHLQRILTSSNMYHQNLLSIACAYDHKPLLASIIEVVYGGKHTNKYLEISILNYRVIEDANVLYHLIATNQEQHLNKILECICPLHLDRSTAEHLFTVIINANSYQSILLSTVCSSLSEDLKHVLSKTILDLDIYHSLNNYPAGFKQELLSVTDIHSNSWIHFAIYACNPTIIDDCVMYYMREFEQHDPQLQAILANRDVYANNILHHISFSLHNPTVAAQVVPLLQHAFGDNLELYAKEWLYEQNIEGAYPLSDNPATNETLQEISGNFVQSFSLGLLCCTEKEGIITAAINTEQEEDVYEAPKLTM